MIPAVIEFNFDPALRLGDVAVRWETLALALTIVVCVGLAAVIAGRTSAVNQAYPEMGGRERGAWHLRRDDLIYILLGVVPAAVLGGRLGYILIHWDFYSEHPGAWFDPTQGSLELSLAVVFGMVAGYAVAAGLGAPAGRWLHIAIVPTLLGLTLGKFVGVLGGNGQGAQSDVAWATYYTGAGPWSSLDAATPAHPSQLYEAVLTLLVLGLIVYLLRIGRFATMTAASSSLGSASGRSRGWRRRSPGATRRSSARSGRPRSWRSPSPSRASGSSCCERCTRAGPCARSSRPVPAWAGPRRSSRPASAPQGTNDRRGRSWNPALPPRPRRNWPAQALAVARWPWAGRANPPRMSNPRR